MTITVAWVRQNKDTSELLIASDSRLRSYGAIDQAQKIFRLERGDCCLGFCGDAQVAYPLFVQVGSTLNNFIRTRTRAEDVTAIADIVGRVLNNLIESWDLPKAEKAEQLASTRILLAGWSWKYRRFDIGYFEADGISFRFHHSFARLAHPWRESQQSLVFIGDYEREFHDALADVLSRRHGAQPLATQTKKRIRFDYEPVEALAALLSKAQRTQELPAIGGAPQLLKIYPHGSDLPIALRISKAQHYLLGRKLFDWEKTGYPVLDLTADSPRIYYPMGAIPLPSNLDGGIEIKNDAFREPPAFGADNTVP